MTVKVLFTFWRTDSTFTKGYAVECLPSVWLMVRTMNEWKISEEMIAWGKEHFDAIPADGLNSSAATKR